MHHTKNRNPFGVMVVKSETMHRHALRAPLSLSLVTAFILLGLPSIVQAQAAPQSWYEDVRVILREIINHEVAKGVAKTVQESSIAVCFYLRHALGRMQSQHWGSVPNALKEDSIHLIGDLTYWYINKQMTFKGDVIEGGLSYSGSPIRDFLNESNYHYKVEPNSVLQATEPVCSPQWWSAVSNHEKSLVESNCGSPFERKVLPCSIAQAVMALIRQQPETAKRYIVEVVAQLIRPLLQERFNGPKYKAEQLHQILRTWIVEPSHFKVWVANLKELLPHDAWQRLPGITCTSRQDIVNELISGRMQFDAESLSYLCFMLDWYHLAGELGRAVNLKIGAVPIEIAWSEFEKPSWAGNRLAGLPIQAKVAQLNEVDLRMKSEEKARALAVSAEKKGRLASDLARIQEELSNIAQQIPQHSPDSTIMASLVARQVQLATENTRIEFELQSLTDMVAKTEADRQDIANALANAHASFSTFYAANKERMDVPGQPEGLRAEIEILGNTWDVLIDKDGVLVDYKNHFKGKPFREINEAVRRVVGQQWRIEEMKRLFGEVGILSIDSIKNLGDALSLIAEIEQLISQIDNQMFFSLNGRAEFHRIFNFLAIANDIMKLSVEVINSRFSNKPRWVPVVERFTELVESDILDKLTSIADPNDYRDLVVMVLSTALAESSREPNGKRDKYYRFVIDFASYILETTDPSQQDTLAREAFRVAAIDLLKDLVDGFPTDKSRHVLGSRWKPLIPTASMRLSWNQDYLNQVGPKGFRQMVSIDTVRLVQYPLSEYAGFQLTLIDLGTPLSELALRSVDYEYQNQGWFKWRVLSGMLRPRLDFWLGLPQLTRAIAVNAGGSIQFLRLYEVSSQDGDDNPIVRYENRLRSPSLELNIGIIVFF